MEEYISSTNFKDYKIMKILTYNELFKFLNAK